MTRLRTRPNSSRLNPFLAGLLLIVAVIGTVLTLEATERTDLGLRRLWAGERKVLAADVLPVLRPVVALRPGEALEPHHVWSNERNDFSTGLMKKDTVEAQGFVTKFSQIRGRVVARPKPAGEPITERDFMPLGTQPGLIGLVPNGMRLVFLDQSRVPGLGSLRFSDRFDLTMTSPMSEEIAAAAKQSLEARGHVKPEEHLRLANSKPLQEQVLLAQYGMVLQQGIKDGKQTLIAIAVDEEDVRRTQDAINSSGDVDCVARPTMAEAPARVIQPPFDPTEPFAWVTENIGEVEIVQGRTTNVETTRRPGVSE